MELQPKSLKFLFFSEAIQRFSSYGIQSILLLFLLKALAYPAGLAYTAYGVFTALSFILAILGGLLADRWLGFRKVVFFGIVLSLIGNIILALNIKGFTMLGLTCTLCGFGLFLPNNSSLLGSFYDPEDSRRSRGFTIFYVGTNVGGLLGPLTYGILSAYGWHYPFIISGIFLLSWIIFYLKFSQYFQGHGVSPTSASTWVKRYEFLAYFLILFLLAGIIFLLKHPVLGGVIVTTIGIISLLFIVVEGLRREGRERKHIFLLILMILCTLVFFASVFQIYTSLLMFVEQYVDRKLISWTIPSSAFTSLEPFFIVIFAPIIARLWKKLNNKNKEPLPLVKMGFGLLLGGVGFVVFAFGAYHAAQSVKNISMIWIILGNVLLGLGELCIMPILIAAITEYAPKAIKSTMMGLLYVSLAFSGYFSSVIGKLTIGNGQFSTPLIYFNVYSKICLITIIIAVLLLVIAYGVNYRRNLLVGQKLTKIAELNN